MWLRVHQLWIGLICVQSMILIIISYSICFQMRLCIFFIIHVKMIHTPWNCCVLSWTSTFQMHQFFYFTLSCFDESDTDVLKTGLLLVWPTSWTPAVGGLFVCEWVCVSADMSPYCTAHDEWLIMKLCMYVGYHTANNVSNFGGDLVTQLHFKNV